MGEPAYVSLELVPVTLSEARRFVGSHHRHNLPPVGWKWGVGVSSEGELVGVAMAGHPIARLLDDGETLEVIRTCTTGLPNANSMLYGAIARAAKALGYRRLITYTLAEESGISLRAAGWTPEAEVSANQSWVRPNSGKRHNVQVDLFGNQRLPQGPKVRWVKVVA